MSVEIFSPVTTQGQPRITSFVDTFDRASSADLGKNWIIQRLFTTPVASAWVSTDYSIGALSDLGQGLKSGVLGINNPAYGIDSMLLPIPLWGIWGKSQSAQWDWVSEPTGVNSFTGPLTLCNPMTGSGYQVAIRNQQYRLYRNGPGGAQLIAPVALASPKTLKLVATINPADTTLTIFIGGVLTDTYVDNNVNRLTTGIPGLYSSETISGGVPTETQWRNFIGGVV